MRFPAIAAAGLALAACSNQPKADEDDLEDFRPPTVQVRGDVVPRQQARFARLDKNTDGVLTPDEYPKRRPERVAALDANKDGKVSRSEMVEGMLNRFDVMDANKDGQVTPDERNVARTAK